MKTKQSLTCLALALTLALSLAACSKRDNAGTDPDHSASPSQSAQPSDNGNDAMEGGGAGGTNDLDNDGQPDGAVPDQSDPAGNATDGNLTGNSADGNSAANNDADGDDGLLGDMADDVSRSIRRAGTATRNALTDAGNAIR